MTERKCNMTIEAWGVLLPVLRELARMVANAVVFVVVLKAWAVM